MKHIFSLITLCLMVIPIAGLHAQDYDIGSPTLTDVWVDPVNGSDANSGASRDQALATLTEAWNRIPLGTELTGNGYHIWLAAGTYPPEALPNYWESRYGTAEFPIIIEAVDGQHTAILPSVNIFDTRYLYFINVDFVFLSDPFHCERCDHLLLRGVTIQGDDPETYNTQEASKFNQSQYIYIENSDISGGWDNAVDFVAVQYGHITGSRIHNSGDWCLYLKGGSAYFRVEGNEFFDCGTGGFTAGQGTGFEFMVDPWLQYEAYAIRFIGNVVHDVEGASAGVNGGYDILIADNVFYRIGARSHLLEATFGARSCDGDTERCQAHLDAGGWGTAEIGASESIPNKNVYVYNNVFYNPAGYESQWQQFFVPAPLTSGANSNIPSPVRADENLQIRGNIIWNGGADKPLGIEFDAGCGADNPTCNAAQLIADNQINTLEPQLADPENGDFTLVSGMTKLPIPDFPAWDVPVPPDPTLTLP
jgi:hypothetical protein